MSRIKLVLVIVFFVALGVVAQEIVASGNGAGVLQPQENICKASGEFVLCSVKELDGYNASSWCASGLQFFAVMIAMIGVILSIRKHNKLVEHNTKVIEADHDLKMRTEAMHALNYLTDHKSNATIREKFSRYYEKKRPIPESKIMEIVDNTDQAEHHLITEYLNSFEKIAVGINNKVYDKKVIKDAIQTRLAVVVIVFEHYINYRQRSNSELFCQMLSLNNEWKEKTEASLNRPLASEKIRKKA